MKSSLMLGVNPNTKRQEDDFYATEPSALILFIERLKLDDIEINKSIWECSCGMGHLSDVLRNYGHSVLSTDLVDRGYINFSFKHNFLDSYEDWQGDILTNPPFKFAEDFVKKSMEILTPNKKLFLFLKIQFLEGQERKKMFKEYPPKYVYCYSARQKCAKDGEFEKYTATTQFYAWFVWEKGFKGEPIIRWI